MGHALLLARLIKERNPKAITVFGGHHPSSLSKETLALPNVDVVVVGEGETGMLSILNEINARGMIHNREVYASPIRNLDAVPFPDRKLIRQDRTLALTEKNDGERIASVLSGRSCPFHCIFCTGDRDVFGSKVRKRSPSNVLDEMAQLVAEWNVEFIKFADAEINTSIDWVQRFCLQKIRRRMTVPWGANIHASIMDKYTLKLMQMANCREIWIGVESGSPRILKEMRKGVTIQMVKNVFRWAKECGIRTRAYFMVGFPNETREDFDMTLRFAEELEADIYGMTILCPFPGTQLYEKYKNELELDKVDWSTADEYGNDFYRTCHFSPEELKAMQAEFTQKFADKLCFRQRDELK